MATSNNIPVALSELNKNKLSVDGGTITGDLSITGDITISGKVIAKLDSNVSGKMDKVIPEIEGNVAILDATGNIVDSKKRLNKSVPKTAVFTDTHYINKNIVSSSGTGSSNTTTSIGNGNVYLNSIETYENEFVSTNSSHKISGSGGSTVTADSKGNIIVTSNRTVETFYVTSLNNVPADAKDGCFIIYEYSD